MPNFGSINLAFRLNILGCPFFYLIEDRAKCRHLRNRDLTDFQKSLKAAIFGCTFRDLSKPSMVYS